MAPSTSYSARLPFRVSGFGFRFSGFRVFGCRVSGFGFRVSGFRFRVSVSVARSEDLPRLSVCGALGQLGQEEPASG